MLMWYAIVKQAEEKPFRGNQQNKKLEPIP